MTGPKTQAVPPGQLDAFGVACCCAAGCNIGCGFAELRLFGEKQIAEDIDLCET
jgi:hypothetical protein